MFGRDYSAMVEGYRLEDAHTAIVAMGSICGTTKDAIDEMRDEGKKVGLLKILLAHSPRKVRQRLLPT